MRPGYHISQNASHVWATRSHPRAEEPSGYVIYEIQLWPAIIGQMRPCFEKYFAHHDADVGSLASRFSGKLSQARIPDTPRERPLDFESNGIFGFPRPHGTPKLYPKTRHG